MDKKLKKMALTATSVIAATLTAATPAMAAQTIFPDVDTEDWHCETVLKLVDEGVINGYDDGTFKPNALINVDTFIKLLTCTITSVDVSNNTSNYWAQPYIDLAYSLGIIDNTEFQGRYTETISREEMCLLAYRAYQSQGLPVLNTFNANLYTDYNECQYKEAIQWCVERGIVTGKDGNLLDPKGLSTRAEAAAIISRLTHPEDRKTITVTTTTNTSDLYNKIMSSDSHLKDFLFDTTVYTEKSPNFQRGQIYLGPNDQYWTYRERGYASRDADGNYISSQIKDWYLTYLPDSLRDNSYEAQLSRALKQFYAKIRPQFHHRLQDTSKFYPAIPTESIEKQPANPELMDTSQYYLESENGLWSYNASSVFPNKWEYTELCTLDFVNDLDLSFADLDYANQWWLDTYGIRYQDATYQQILNTIIFEDYIEAVDKTLPQAYRLGGNSGTTYYLPKAEIPVRAKPYIEAWGNPIDWGTDIPQHILNTVDQDGHLLSDNLANYYVDWVQPTLDKAQRFYDNPLEHGFTPSEWHWW